MRALLIGWLLAQAGACAPSLAEEGAESAPAPEASPPPRGTRIEPSGYATILEASSVPYPEAVPPDPHAEAPRDPNPYAMMNPDPATMEAALRLERRLIREAPGNYVDVKVIRDPRPRFAFYFRRDAEATLARFTRDPRFKAVEGGLPERELKPLFEEWAARFQKRNLGFHGSIRTFEGDVELNLGVPRSEFERVAAQEGWPAPPPRLKLNFAEEVNAAAAVAPDVAPFIRVFARADQSPGMVLSVLNSGRVVLRDGCFRQDDGKGGSPHVLFGRETVLRRDAEGWLTVSDPNSGESGARIGEPLVWGGYPPAREDEPGVRALRALCGQGPIVSVGVPESAHGFRVRPWAITAYARGKGLSRQAAWEEIKACWAREDARLAAARPGGPPPAPPLDCDSLHPGPPPPPPPSPPPR